MLHFWNTLRIEEKQSDLLHVATVCTDLTDVVTKNYLGKGASQPEHLFMHLGRNSTLIKSRRLILVAI